MDFGKSAAIAKQGHGLRSVAGVVSLEQSVTVACFEAEGQGLLKVIYGLLYPPTSGDHL